MQLKFNSQLDNLCDDDVLSFKNFYLKVNELRYALDLALLGKISDVLVELLRLHEIQIELESHVDEAQEYLPSNNRWFQDGVACKVLNPETNQWRRGKIKLQIALEFCPHESEHPEAVLIFSERESVKRSAIKKYLYASTLSESALSEARIPEFDTRGSSPAQVTEKVAVLSEV